MTRGWTEARSRARGSGLPRHDAETNVRRGPSSASEMKAEVARARMELQTRSGHGRTAFELLCIYESKADRNMCTENPSRPPGYHINHIEIPPMPPPHRRMKSLLSGLRRVGNRRRSLGRGRNQCTGLGRRESRSSRMIDGFSRRNRCIDKRIFRRRRQR